MPEMTIRDALQLALRHHHARDLPQAESIYRQVLAIDPQNPDALHLLGVIAVESGRPDAAADLIARAIAIKSDVPDFHRNLGLAHQACGNFTAACESFTNAANLRPDWAEMHSRRGSLLAVLGKTNEAIEALSRAIELDPDPDTLANLGSALGIAGKLENSIHALQRALQLKPDVPHLHYNLAASLRELGLVTQSIAHFREAIRLQPNYPNAHSGLLLTLHYIDISRDHLLEAHRQWDQQLVQPLRAQCASPDAALLPSPGTPGEGRVRVLPTQPELHSSTPTRRLRIGYVSADFREHAARYFLEPLLAAHDREELEIVCYSSAHPTDEITARFQRHASLWRETRTWNDGHVVQAIQSDRIDILVDLALHSGGSRLLAMACKPAPVQFSYLGYCSTTGLPEIAARLTDEIIDPTGVPQFGPETPIRLAGGFCAYQPPESAPDIADPSAAREVRFASFNNLAKITDPTLKLWSQILRDLPGATLLIQARGSDQPTVRQRITELFQRERVDPDRIEFGNLQSMPDYLSSASSADICLDCHPFNGHTTTCHALWMGVPIITRFGDIPVSRVGLSLLTTLDLCDLAVATDDEYVRRAIDLARDLDRRAHLRRTMRDRMRASPLMDPHRLARQVESAYRSAWQAWCEQGGQT